MISVLTTVLILTPLATAQTAGGESQNLFQRAGSGAHEYFGWDVADAGDVNNDGVHDIVVSATDAHVHSPGPGNVTVYSGATGSVLHSWTGAVDGDQFGFSVAGAGDTNGDGYDDILIGAPEEYTTHIFGGGVYLYSGANGALLHHWSGNTGDHVGHSVAGLGDLNGDGYSDIALGGKSAGGGSGVVRVRSGIDGSHLYYWNGTGSDNLGYAIAAGGDIDNDGVGDILLGAPGGTIGTGVDNGVVYVISGANFLTIYAHFGEDGSRFGSSISGLGDINSDGLGDFIVGAPNGTHNGLSFAGAAYVMSGTGSTLWSANGDQQFARFGASVAGVGDTDGDGVGDYLVGAPRATHNSFNWSGSAYLYSGKLGIQLCRWNGPSGDSYFGNSVASAGDSDGDGRNELLIGAWGIDNGFITYVGRAFVYSFDPFLHLDTTSLSASQTTPFSLDLDFPDTAAAYSYRVLLSRNGPGPFNHGIKIPLTYDDLLVDTWNGNYRFLVNSSLQGTLDAQGDATALGVLPAGSATALVGSRFWVAAVAFPAGSLPVYSTISVPISIEP